MSLQQLRAQTVSEELQESETQSAPPQSQQSWQVTDGIVDRLCTPLSARKTHTVSLEWGLCSAEQECHLEPPQEQSSENPQEVPLSRCHAQSPTPTIRAPKSPLLSWTTKTNPLQHQGQEEKSQRNSSDGPKAKEAQPTGGPQQPS